MSHAPSWHSRLRSFDSRDPEELEALSRKYSSAAIILLPLVGGTFALFDNAHTFRLIAEEDDLTYSTLSKLSLQWESELRAETHHVERLREMGMEPPDARRLARDIRRAPETHPEFRAEALDPESVA